MKLKFGKIGNEYFAGVYTGNGGISSLVNYKQSKSFWKVLSVFKIKNLWISIIGKRKINDI